ATLLDDRGNAISEAFHFVTRREPPYQSDVKLDIAAKQVAEGLIELQLRSDRFLQAVRFDAPGFLPDDAYFHLKPGRPKNVRFTGRRGGGRWRVSLEALNLRNPIICTLKD